MLKPGDYSQVIAGEIGRTDAKHVAVARAVVDIMGPSSARAVARDVDDLNQKVDEVRFGDTLRKRARNAIEPATRRRPSDNLNRPFRLPGLLHGYSLWARLRQPYCFPITYSWRSDPQDLCPK